MIVFIIIFNLGNVIIVRIKWYEIYDFPCDISSLDLQGVRTGLVQFVLVDICAAYTLWDIPEVPQF